MLPVRTIIIINDRIVEQASHFNYLVHHVFLPLSGCKFVLFHVDRLLVCLAVPNLKDQVLRLMILGCICSSKLAFALVIKRLLPIIILGVQPGKRRVTGRLVGTAIRPLESGRGCLIFECETRRYYVMSRLK